MSATPTTTEREREREERGERKAEREAERGRGGEERPRALGSARRCAVWGPSPPALALTLCLPLSPSVSRSHPLSPALTLCPPLSPSVSSSHPLSPALTLCPPLSPSVSRSHPLSPALTLCLSLSPSVSRSHPLSPALTLCLPLSPSVSRSHPLSPALTLCLFRSGAPSSAQGAAKGERESGKSPLSLSSPLLSSLLLSSPLLSSPLLSLLLRRPAAASRVPDKVRAWTRGRARSPESSSVAWAARRSSSPGLPGVWLEEPQHVAQHRVARLDLSHSVPARPGGCPCPLAGGLVLWRVPLSSGGWPCPLAGALVLWRVPLSSGGCPCPLAGALVLWRPLGVCAPAPPRPSALLNSSSLSAQPREGRPTETRQLGLRSVTTVTSRPWR